MAQYCDNFELREEIDQFGLDDTTDSFETWMGLRGPAGPAGATGATGATPNLTIGTVTGGASAAATITGTAENPVLNLTLPKGDKGDTGEVSEAELNTALSSKAPIIVNTASGDIASFSDGADDLPVKSLVANIEPVQDLSNGDPSPTNICPITGHSTMTIYDDPAYGGTINFNQLFPHKSGTSSLTNFTVTGNNDGSFTIVVSATTSSGDGNHTSISGGTFTAGHTYLMLSDNDSIEYRFKAYGKTSPCIFTPSTASYNNISFKFEDLPAGTYTVRPQLFDLTQMFGEGNEPTTVAEFEALFPNGYYAYNTGETTCVSAVNGDEYTKITIDLGGTRYGGSLDVISGVLTVTDANIASYNGETLPSTWISDRDVYAEGTTPTIGAQVVYKLATPTTVQLTATEVDSLLGENNIWHSANGNTAVTFRSDTKGYVDNSPILKEMSSADTSVTLEKNKFYLFPEMDELTITCPTTGMYSFRFTSGTTATVLSMSGITMPDGFSVMANKVYEINILNGYAVSTNWSVS